MFCVRAQEGTPGHENKRHDRQPGVDQRWQQKYGQDQRFHFTPAQLAAWYNERYDVTGIIEFGIDGRANASVIGRPERTPSLAYTKDRKRFTDFGASATRTDGKPDGGDVLELRVQVNAAQSGLSKSETLRQVAQEFLGEAEAAQRAVACQACQTRLPIRSGSSPGR